MTTDKFVIGERRSVAKPARRKMTIEMDAGDDALVRLVARDWGLSLGDAVGLMARSFVGAGWAAFSGVSLDAAGMARIRDALARWDAQPDQPPAPRLDPSIHAGPEAGT